MLISVDAHIPFSRPLVYATYRDKLPQLVPYLPNVRQIEVKQRSEKDGLIHLVNEWHGGGEIPFLARSILTEAMLSWTDYTSWNESEFTADWRTDTHVFTEAVHCTGRNRFLEEGSSTLIESRGELTIDTHQIKGWPQQLTSMVGQMVEDFLSKQIGPNLLHMSEGVRQYLEARSNV